MRGKRKLLFPAIACLSLVLAPRAGAQDQSVLSPARAGDGLRVLRIAECEGDGIRNDGTAGIQSLITSYVVELGIFRVIDTKGQELALREAETAVQMGSSKDMAPLAAADFILSSRADSVGTHIVFSMDVTRASTGEKRSVSDSFTSENDLLLSLRRLTRKLFEIQDAGLSPEPAARSEGTGPQGMHSAPKLSLLSGTWKGDKNLDRVTIMRDGRGFAVLASGVRMSLKVTIDGSKVIVAQNQPNSPDFYRPSLDFKSARIVAKGARPWRWAFSLSVDGASLIGIKESVFVTVSEAGAVSLDNNYVRDAVWTRLYR